MRIVLLGPPGAGKGSLASLCEERLGIAHLSPGAIFRKEIARKSKLGIRVGRFVARGKLVPDELVVKVMASRLVGKTLRDGFLLDGFPRTFAQATELSRILRERNHPLDGAVHLRTPERVLVSRLAGRRVCAKCGANYHIRNMRPKRANHCDRCNGKLIIRRDDRPQTIKQRLLVDRKSASGLLNYYAGRKQLYRISGLGSIETVFGRALTLFRKQDWLGA